MLNHEAFAKQAPFMESRSYTTKWGNYAVLLDEKIDLRSHRICLFILFPKVFIVLNNKRMKAPKSLY